MNKLNLGGIVPPMITPLLDNDTLDVEGLGRLTEHMIGGGVNAIFLLGSTGEAQSLSYRLKYEFVEKACRFIGGRVPVLVGITDTSFDESIRLAEFAKECGAVAVVAAAPYYFPASQKELEEYYTALADASPLPLFLYNMPSKVKVFLDAPTVIALSKHPNIIGLKDSSGNMGYFSKLMYYFKDSDFSIFIGPEETTGACVLMGAEGGVNGGANLFPKLFTEMFKAAASKQIDRVNELQKKIMTLSESLYGLFPSDASFVKAIKASLEIKGICSSFLPWPYRGCSDAEKEKIAAILEKLEQEGIA